MQDTVTSFTRSLILEELRSKRCQRAAGSKVVQRLLDCREVDDQAAPLEEIRHWVKQEMERMAKKLEEGI